MALDPISGAGQPVYPSKIEKTSKLQKLVQLVECPQDISFPENNNPALGKKIALIYIRAMVDGKERVIVLKPEDFQGKKRPYLRIDGYLTGVAVFYENDKALKVNLNNRELSAPYGLHEEKNGPWTTSVLVGERKNSSMMRRTVHQDDPAFNELLPLQKREGMRASLSGNFELGSMFVYDDFHNPLNAEALNRVSLLGDGFAQFSLVIHSNRKETVASYSGRPLLTRDNLKIDYIGDKESLPIYKNDPGLKAKYEIIRQQIDQIENLFGQNFVETISIQDNDARINNSQEYNCMIDVPTKTIIFNKNNIIETKEPDLVATVAHETLHTFCTRNGFDSSDANNPFWNFFLKIDKEFSSVFRTDSFCDFIDEKNFMGAAGLGHSQQSVAELTTSFMHSLVHIDRLKDNLLRITNPKQRQEILGRYMEMLEAFMAESKLKSPKIKEFFQAKYQVVLAIKQELFPK